MRYAFNPKVAQMMLDMCHSGNNIYEVTYRYSDESIGISYSQAETADEAEYRFTSQYHVESAVARRVREI